jgi:predicted dehydrogenase
VLDGQPCFGSVDEACAAVDGLRAAVVATPPDLHAGPCRAALSAGLPVLVEKPFTTSLAEAAALVREAEGHRLPLLVAQNYRYLRAHRAVRTVLRSGRLGRLGFVSAHYFRGHHHMADHLSSLSHRVLWGVAVHHLDAIRWVLGQRTTGLFARSYNTGYGAGPPGATLDVLAEFDGGVRLNYSATYESRGHQYFEDGQEYYQRITGDRGTLHVVHRWLVLCPDRRLPRLIRRGPRPETEESLLLGQFADAIESGGEAECSGRDNLQTMAMLEACVRSDTENRWIDPQELLDELT